MRTLSASLAFIISSLVLRALIPSLKNIYVPTAIIGFILGVIGISIHAYISKSIGWLYTTNGIKIYGDYGVDYVYQKEWVLFYYKQLTKFRGAFISVPDTILNGFTVRYVDYQITRTNPLSGKKQECNSISAAWDKIMIINRKYALTDHTEGHEIRLCIARTMWSSMMELSEEQVMKEMHERGVYDYGVQYGIFGSRRMYKLQATLDR